MERPTSTAFPFEIRATDDLEELHACEAVAKLVWQVDDREIVPASHLRSLAHGGGLVAVARLEGAVIGFSVGFLARHADADPIGLHSHLMGVLPSHRGAGVAHAMKWFQRDWCLERGLDWITWTFDPLQAGSARRALASLGAYGEHYERDYYGSLGGTRFGSLPTDRLLVRWELGDERVRSLAAADPRAKATTPGTATVPPPGSDTTSEADHGHDATEPAWALAPGPGGGPGDPSIDLAADAVRIAVPPDFGALLYRAPETALAWRHAVREAMEAYMGRGYRPRHFLDGAFRLDRTPQARQSETQS